MARSVYVAAEYKEDPLGFLIKLMDLTQYATELKSLSNGLLRILIYVNTDSGQYEHPAFPALGSVLF